MNDLSTAFLAKAEEELDSARVLLDVGRLGGAVGRAYYAMFQSAQAMLATLDQRFRTHRGVHDAFWKAFGATGKVPPELSKWLARTANLRGEADYGLDFDPEFDLVAEVVAQARDFVATVKRFLADEG